MKTSQTMYKSFLLALIFFSSLSVLGQRAIRITGVSKFENIEELDWSNTTGELFITRDSVNFCASAYEDKCMGLRLFGDITVSPYKYKGKQFTQRIQSATTNHGDTIIVRKVLAKKYEKYYDFLWLDWEDQPDLVWECENLVRRK